MISYSFDVAACPIWQWTLCDAQDFDLAPSRVETDCPPPRLQPFVLGTVRRQEERPNGTIENKSECDKVRTQASRWPAFFGCSQVHLRRRPPSRFESDATQFRLPHRGHWTASASPTTDARRLAKAAHPHKNRSDPWRCAPSFVGQWLVYIGVSELALLAPLQVPLDHTPVINRLPRRPSPTTRSAALTPRATSNVSPHGTMPHCFL